MKESIIRLFKLSKSITAKNTYLVFFGNALAGFLGMIAMILVSRFLGPSGFGTFSVAFALSTLLVKFGDMGLNFGMVREVSQSRAKNEKENIPKIFLSIILVKALICLILNSNFLSLLEFFLRPIKSSLLVLRYIFWLI
jgi:O-antigen/teichoic acid export membrane protein